MRPDDRLEALPAHAWSGRLDGYAGVAPLHRNTGIRWNCIIPWRDMTIAFDGKIVSCCGDLDAKNVIDDVSRKTIYEVWNGPQFQQFRHAMLTNEIEKWPLCGGCDRIWTEKPSPLDYDLKMEMLRFKLKM